MLSLGSFVLIFRVPPSTGKLPWTCCRGLDTAAMAERRAIEDIIVFLLLCKRFRRILLQYVRVNTESEITLTLVTLANEQGQQAKRKQRTWYDTVILRCYQQVD